MENLSPCNLICVTYQKLIDSGYQPVEIKFDKKGNTEFPPVGSLLCIINSTKDMWVKLSAADIKASKVTPDKFLILNK